MIDKIKINNTMYEGDAQGVADLGTYLKEHQSLADVVHMSQMVVVTLEQWAQLSSSPDPNTFYFVMET